MQRSMKSKPMRNQKYVLIITIANSVNIVTKFLSVLPCV